MEIIEKIRKKIERMRKEMDNDTLLASNQQAGYLFALAEIQGFLNSLQEETCKESLHIPETCKENQDSLTLDEAAEEYSEGIIGREDAFMCKAAFIAGAEWQEKQDEVEKNLKYLYGMDEGARIMKEQMMEDAVEGEIMTNGFYPYEPRIVASYPNCPYAFGNKVKLIIVKED